VSWRWCATASATPRWVSTTPTRLRGTWRRPIRWIYSRDGRLRARPLRAAPGESHLPRPTLGCQPHLLYQTDLQGILLDFLRHEASTCLV
jgi:hypothetical protein